MKRASSQRKTPTQGFKHFLWKTLVFLILFIAISLLIGQKVVSSSLLYGFGIFIYGGMGYILLFSVLGFILLCRKRLMALEVQSHTLLDVLFILLAGGLLSLFYFIELNIPAIKPTVLSIGAIHLVFLGMFASLVIGIYTLGFIKKFYTTFKKELLYFLIFGIIAYALMTFVWRLWPYLSFVVAHVSYFLLHLLNPSTRLFYGSDTTPILQVGSFAAKIAEACSGVYSIFLFTALYVFILLVDWKKLSKKKMILVFFPALIGAFLVNIIRVVSLMLVGAHISRSLALGLYHSYVGTVLFMIYFIVFWSLAYKRMLKNKTLRE